MLPVLMLPSDIRTRLNVIFPEGMPGRGFVIREMTARTVFTALYVGAVQGTDRWFAPRHVVRMGDLQAGQADDAARLAYYDAMNRPSAPHPANRWYAENSREPLRDEVIRQGLVPVNAIIERGGLSTTSSLPRYALTAAFAGLFDPALDDDEFETLAEGWRGLFLSAAALARAALVRSSSATAAGNTTVQCPSGPSVVLPPGPSPAITKAVIEVFAPQFLGDPRVAWISDSASKQPFQDAPLASALQITLDAASLLPDVVLVDLDPPGRPNEVLIVFVEVVASDGPVNEQRKAALMELAASSPRGYTARDVAFVTAYADRGSDPARRTMASLAWGSFAWFVSEPDRLIQLHDSEPVVRKISALL